GMMIAYAFGSEYPDLVERLVLMEAVLPGTAAYDRLVASPRLVGAPMWHFYFHNAGDGLAEALTAGRERLYLRHFYDRHAFDPEAIGPEDLDRYTDAFATAGAMRAGFEIYRAFDQDAVDNRAALARNGRLRVPVLALGGDASFFPSIAAEMVGEFVEDVTVDSIPRCGHWIPEENPTALIDHVLRFAGAS
ncbi:MAG TPA: alpha/beta hydrolase, partial [Ilumatobacteraceae bacterium]